MLKDFAKMMTFLTVVRERSFSKASAKLGISQPAVTQQIKYIEEYMQSRLLDRKKNGIVLTKEGEELYKIILRLEKCIQTTEKEIVRIIDKELNFIISSSFTIGSYILPNYLEDIKEGIGNEVFINIKKSKEAIDDLMAERADIALIESPFFQDGVVYREWMEDELVFFSNMPLPKTLKASDMKRFAWVCREDGSHTKKIMSEVFGDLGITCMDDFEIRSILTDSTAVKQTVLKYPLDAKKQVIAVMSRVVVADEVERGILFESRIKGKRIKRKLYIAYLKQDRRNAFVENVVKYLQNIKPAKSPI